jgi:DNA-binding SARP family transcriptional activator
MVQVGGGPPGLAVRLLGAVSVRWRGQEVPVHESARVVSLLGYLLLHRDAPQPRPRIAASFWPDSTESQARTNLRHLLHHLRRALPEADRYLQATPQTLGWRGDAPLWLDVAEFEAALAAGEHSTTALRTAVDLYTGDLMEGVYDDWLAGDRERLRAGFLDALRRLATAYERRGDLAAAVRVGEALLRQDPLAEPTYQQLIRLHAARGDRARAVRAYHACADVLERELGAQPSPATQRLYRGLLATEGRPAAAVRSRVTRAPLVGRLPERAALTSAWRAVAAGADARLVLVTGEAGIGKSRLVEELRSWCAQHGAATGYGRAYPAEGPIAYGLVVSWLRSGAMADRVRGLAPGHLSELVRLLPELRDERPDLDRPLTLPDADQRQRLLGAVTRVVLAPGAPVLLVGDDLQWADQESLRAVHYLLRAAHRRGRLLVVGTARWEDLEPGHPLAELVTAVRARGPYVELPLARLTEAETGALAARLLGREPAPAACAALHADTEGNPLFVVEAVRFGWRGAADRDPGGTASGPADRAAVGTASGAADRAAVGAVSGATDRAVGAADQPAGGTASGAAGGEVRLSPRVQAVIESRLSRLPAPALDLAGVAAAIGRDFSVDVLADASGADEDALVAGLDELWRRGFIREHTGDAYDFSHGRVRDVIYDALTPARRRRHHLRIARALQRRHPTEAGPLTAQVAAHFARGGAIEEAVDWYLRAAEALHLLPAQAEVVRLLDRARELLGRLPEGPARDARELAVLTAQAAPLAVVESLASPRLVPLLERALRLARSLRVPPAPPVLRWLAVASLARGEFDRARRLAARLGERGTGADPEGVVLGVEAGYVQGIAAFWQGRLREASAHFEAAVARYRPADLTVHLRRYGLDPRAVCQSRLANTWWFLGRAAAAVRARETALTWAEEVAHPATRGTVLVFAALLALEMRDQPRVREYTAALREWAGAGHAALAVGGTAEVLAGYLDVRDGQPARGLDRIRRQLDTHRAVDLAPGARAAHVRVLLAACAAAGDPAAGLAAAERALTAGDGVSLWESEARRVRAELLAATGAPGPEVTAELDRALAVARDQGARLFELRALTAAARRAGAAGAARDRLAAVVTGLPEAAGTPDHADAVAVLGGG